MAPPSAPAELWSKVDVDHYRIERGVLHGTAVQARRIVVEGHVGQCSSPKLFAMAPPELTGVVAGLNVTLENVQSSR